MQQLLGRCRLRTTAGRAPRPSRLARTARAITRLALARSSEARPSQSAITLLSIPGAIGPLVRLVLSRGLPAGPNVLLTVRGRVTGSGDSARSGRCRLYTILPGSGGLCPVMPSCVGVQCTRCALHRPRERSPQTLGMRLTRARSPDSRGGAAPPLPGWFSHSYRKVWAIRIRDADQTGPSVASVATTTMNTSMATMLSGLKVKGALRSTAPSSCTKP